MGKPTEADREAAKEIIRIVGVNHGLLGDVREELLNAALLQDIADQVAAAREQGRQDYATNEAVEAKKAAFAQGHKRGAERERRACAFLCDRLAHRGESALACRDKIRARSGGDGGEQAKAS